MASVPEFYSGKSIFISGGSGFVGKVLIYKLLKSCPDVKVIYLLMRQKKGVPAEDRLKALFENRVFDVLREEHPEFPSKLRVVTGDIMSDGLGLSPADKEELLEHCNIVFHSAACVRFDLKLKEAVNLNVKGTLRMLTLAESMKNLEAFVHLSTAYCRCELPELEEKLYKAVHNPRHIMDMVDWMDDELLAHIEPKVIESEPNTYSYTKAITEDLVAEYGDKFPTAIARPSIGKWLYDGDGGVESQALPAAAATGAAPAAKETAARKHGPGPVQKRKRPGQSKRKLLRLRQEEARSEAVLGAAGTGRGGSGASTPSYTMPHKSGGKNHCKKQSAYLKEEAERADAINRSLVGIAKLSGLTELAPAVVACMDRINPVGAVVDGVAGLSTVVTPSHSVLPVRDSVPGGCVAGSIDVTDRKPSQQVQLGNNTANAEILKDLVMRKTQDNRPTTTQEVAKGSGGVLLPRAPLQTPFHLDRVVGGARKGCDGTSTTPIRTEVMFEAKERNSSDVEVARATKRQRSSDQVSPSLAAADKKLCLASGSSDDVAGLGEAGGTLTGGEGQQEVSYASAVKRYRVVVQDRNGIMMDNPKATLLRKSIDKAQYDLFKANRAVPKNKRRLPVFGQRLARLLHGCLKITPCDDFSLAWLVSTLETMPPLWEGSGGFQVIPESELPRYHTGIIYVPDFNEERDDLERWPFILREFLSELNKSYNIEGWPVFKHIVRQKGQTFNHILVMGIPAVEVENLKKTNNRLHYTTGSVYVKVKDNKIGVPARPKAEAGRVASAAKSGEGTSSAAVTSAEAVPPEDKDWTREEVDRLLEVSDEGEEDITGDIMGLTIFSPLSLMDTEREGADSVHSLDN